MTEALPDDFLTRMDSSPDTDFYAMPRFVTHIDDAAIAAVGALYAELQVAGRVLDLMSSWVSHLPARPEALTVLGLNADELAANPMATTRVVHDLNADPTLPFTDAEFDAALCCVSIDYLIHPVEVLAETARPRARCAGDPDLLQPLFPDQGRPRVARDHRRRPSGRVERLPAPGRRFHRAGGRAADAAVGGRRWALPRRPALRRGRASPLSLQQN